jgi:polar amino acid transport system substrate-binding protein
MLLRPLFARLGLLALIVAVPIGARAENDALDRITKAGTIRIAVPDNFPPFGDLGPDMKLHGYDIDTAALLAKALGVKSELIAVSSTDRVPYLTGDKIDLVISSLGKDAERERLIDFSIAYAPFFSGVFGPQRVEIAKPEDLAGKTIAVTRNSIEDTVLTQLAPQTASVKRYDDNAASEIAYLSSQTELIATANSVAAQLLARSPMRKTTFKFLLRNSPCYIGVRKGEPELLARINQIIAAARNDGTLNGISERWLKAPLGDPEQPHSTIK